MMDSISQHITFIMINNYGVLRCPMNIELVLVFYRATGMDSFEFIVFSSSRSNESIYFS